MRRALLLAALAGALPLSVPAHAQDSAQTLTGTGSVADIPAGTYVVEPGHTQVAFSVSHMGISPFAGMFSGASGSLTIDPARLDASALTVTIPIDSVRTTSTVLDGELKGADWFDAAKFPTATFRSTKLVRTGENTADVHGTLTLHGVTRPEVIHARLFGATTNAMNKKFSIGFLGRLVLKRSDYGVSKYVPLVSDTTVLIINAAFEAK